MLPFATAFGTANGLVQQTGYSAYATLLALAIVADLMFTRLMSAAIRGGIVLYVCLMLFWSSLLPYGLPASVYRQDKAVTVLSQGETIYVDQVTEAYLRDLQSIARSERLGADTPIIDLTGGGPGTVFALCGKAPYYPWIVHIFERKSFDLANTIWASLSQADKERAWILLPGHKAFEHTNAMMFFQKNRNRYRLAGRSSMLFWGQTKDIQIWVPYVAVLSNRARNIR